MIVMIDLREEIEIVLAQLTVECSEPALSRLRAEVGELQASASRSAGASRRISTRLRAQELIWGVILCMAETVARASGRRQSVARLSR
jgi:hypothetical protein